MAQRSAVWLEVLSIEGAENHLPAAGISWVAAVRAALAKRAAVVKPVAVKQEAVEKSAAVLCLPEQTLALRRETVP